MFCLCMSEVISSFKSLRARPHVLALLMLFHCVILHSCGQIRACSSYVYFPLVYCIFCHQNDVCRSNGLRSI